MKNQLIKCFIIILLFVFNTKVYSQQLITSAGSPLEVKSSISDVTSMSNAVYNFKLQIKNTTNNSLTGDFQIEFPAEFRLVFPSSLPSGLQISNSNPYTVSVSNLAANATVDLNYTVAACFLSDFGNDLFKTRNIIFSTGNNTILAPGGVNQIVNVFRGQAITIVNPVTADNHAVFMYEGSRFIRTYHVASNGSNNIPFKGIIEFEDNLGSAADIIKLEIVFPGSVSSLIPVTYKIAANHVKYSFDVSAYLPNGLLFGNEIQIIETVKVIGCLDGGMGNSVVNINWDKSLNGTCLRTERTLSPTITRPSDPLIFPLSVVSNYPQDGTTCFKTPTSNNGVYTLTKRFENNISGRHVDLENIEILLTYGLYTFSHRTKRPLEGVKVVRTNTLNPSRALTIDFASMASQTDFNGVVVPFIQQYSRRDVKRTADENYYYPSSPNINVIDTYPSGTDDCWNTANQFERLTIDRYPDGNGGYINLDFLEGDIYEVTWNEIQCCRTDEIAENHGGNNRRSSHAGCSMEYILCNNAITVNNDGSPAAYFNILDVSESFLANSTKILNGNPDRDANGPTRDGEVGDMHVEHLYTGGEFNLNGYRTTDNLGNDIAFYEVDVLLEDGLSMNLGGINPVLPNPTFNASIVYKNGSGLSPAINWQPVIINKTAGLSTNPKYITNSDNINIPTGTGIAATEYYTLRFSLNDFADQLGLTPNAVERNLDYLLNQMGNTELFFQLKAVSCPTKSKATVAVRSYVINNQQCNDCRNLASHSGFEINIHCPGCIIPGAAVSAVYTGRDISSVGPKDNDNDGVPDADQSAANPDQRNLHMVRLGDLLRTTVVAELSDGDNAKGGFTYNDLLAGRPEYILEHTYLRSNFYWTAGGLELQTVTATLKGRGASLKLLDVDANIFPSAGKILMENSGSMVDYTSATPVNGFRTSQYKSFYFHVSVKDFVSSDINGFDWVSLGGNTDEITFDVTYRVVKDITAPDNIVEVVHLVYSAKEPDTYAGINNSLDVGETCKNGSCASVASLPADRAIFWCQGGDGIFGFVKYLSNDSYYLQDPFIETYNYETLPSCKKRMRMVSETFPIDNTGRVYFNAFPNEYRTVGHPLQYKVEIPAGYTISSINMVNTNFIDYNRTRGVLYDITQRMPLAIPSISNPNQNNYITLPVPAYVDATSSTPGTFSPVSTLNSMDELSYNELIIELDGSCNNSAIAPLIYWTDDLTRIPAGIPKLNLPEVTIPNLPVEKFLLPSGTTSQIDIALANRYPRQYGNFIFVKPQTDIQVTNNNSTNIVIDNSYFDFGIRVKNTPPKDAAGNIIPDPYNSALPMKSINAEHTYVAFSKSSLPAGLHIDYIYSGQSPVADPNSNVAASSKILALPSGTTNDVVFDLGNIPASSEQNFRIVGHYDCAESGCDPISAAMNNCLNNVSVNLNYGWNCSVPVPGSLSSCDVNQPLTYTFTNDKVTVNVSAPLTQSVVACQSNNYQLTMNSLENGFINRHLVTITLPDNAIYTNGSSKLNGTNAPDPVIAGAVLTFDFQNLNSNINNNSNYTLEFSYILQCVSEGVYQNTNTLSAQVESFTYCNSTATSNRTTQLNYTIDKTKLDGITLNTFSYSSDHTKILIDYTVNGTLTHSNNFIVQIPGGTPQTIAITPGLQNPYEISVDPTQFICPNTYTSSVILSRELVEVCAVGTPCSTMINEPPVSASYTPICNPSCSLTVGLRVDDPSTTDPNDPSLLCPGQSVNLIATPGFASYVWTKDGVIQSYPAATSTITVATAGYYTVSVSENNCDASAGVSVVTKPVLQGDGEMCEGQTPSLFVNLFGAICNNCEPEIIKDGSIYTGTGGNKFQNFIGAIPLAACTLYTDPFPVKVKPNPAKPIIYPGFTLLCPTDPISIPLTITNLGSMVNMTSYSWSSGQTNENPITVTSAGRYTLTVLADGCTSEGYAEIVVPEIFLTQECIDANTIILHAAYNMAGGDFVWTDAMGNILVPTDPSDPSTMVATAGGMYIVTIINPVCGAITASISPAFISPGPGIGMNMVANGNFANSITPAVYPAVQIPYICPPVPPSAPDPANPVISDLSCVNVPFSGFNQMVGHYTVTFTDAGFWNHNLWNGTGYVITPGSPTERNYLLADGAKTSKTERVWFTTVNVTLGKRYNFRALVNNVINKEGQVPLVSLQIGANTNMRKQTIYANQPRWVELSGDWIADVSGDVEIAVMLDPGGVIGRDIGVDEISFEEIICEPSDYGRPCLAKINVGPDKYVCPGLPVLIGANVVAPGSGLQYEWTSDGGAVFSTDANTIVNPSVTTTYTLTVIDPVNNCRAIDNITVNSIVPNNVVTAIASPAAVCSDGITQLKVSVSGTGNYAYTWTPATGLSSATIQNPIATISAKTIFTVTATDLIGCYASGQVTVDMANFNVSINPDKPVITCTPAILSATGGVSWLWSDGSTTQSISTNIGGPYSVTATDVNGCTSQATINVLYYDPPAPAITPSGSTALCTGESVVLTASQGASYSWSDGSTTQSITVTTPGNYSVVITDNYQCLTTADISVTLNPTPPAPSTQPVSYCQNSPAVPLAGSGTGLKWYTVPVGGISSSIRPTPVTTVPGVTNYYLTQTINGCESARALIPVTINSLPANPTVVSPVNYCQNATASPLTATGTGSLFWYTVPSGGAASSIAPTPLTTAVGSTTYYVSQTENGCQGSKATIEVNVNAIPASPITSPVSYCRNSTAVPLSATGTSLQWYTTASGGTGSSTAPTPATNGAGTTTYYVTQTINGCESARASIAVTVSSAVPGAPTVVSPVSYCQNDVATPLTATGSGLKWYTVLVGGIGSTTAPTPVTTSSGNTTYYVSQSNGCGESQRAAIVVTVNPVPLATINPSGSVSANVNVLLKANTGGGLTYKWFQGVNQVGSNSTYLATTTGNYTVEVTNSSGCKATSAITTVSIGPTGIHTLSGIEAFSKIYPNPAGKLITIETHLDLETASIKLIDALGGEVSVPITITGTDADADVSSLKEGVYTLLITQDNYIIRKKIVIIH